MNTTDQHEMIWLRPYSFQELANIYGVGVKTLKKWLLPFENDIGVRQGRYYTVAQVKVIFDKLGLPGPIG
jgi:hypothetical protein